MPGPLRSFGYVSRSCAPPERIAAEIDHIIAVTMQTDDARAITGALVHTGRHFAQLLEGPPGAIWTLKARLARDIAHQDLVELHDLNAEVRRFEEWAIVYDGRATYIDRVLERLHRGSAELGDTEGLAHFMRELALS